MATWRRLATVIGASVVLVASSLAGAGVASAADPIRQPLDIAVSPSGDRIFTTWDGLDEGGITVLHPDGSISGEIDDPGAGRMAVGGGAVFATNRVTSTIDRFDLSSAVPAADGSFPIPGGRYAVSVAWAGSHLFVVAGSAGDVRIFAVERDGSPWTDLTPSGLALENSTQVTAVPGQPKIVIVSGSFVGTYNATVPLSGSHTGMLPSISDGSARMAVESDGEHLLTSDNFSYAPHEFSLSDFSEGTEYLGTIQGDPRAIATNKNTTRFAVGTSTSQGNMSLAIYEPGVAAPRATYSMGYGVAALAFSPDGASLYVVWEDVDFHFWMSTFDPAISDASLGLTLNPKRPVAGDTAKLRVHLNGGNTNRSVSVYQREVGENAQLIASEPVNEDGDLTLTLHPRHYVSYWAVYDGDALWNAARTEKLNVDVGSVAKMRLLHSYGSDDGDKLYHRGDRVSVRVWTDPLEPHEDIQVGLDVKVRHRWRGWVGPDPYSMGRTGRIVLYLPGSFFPTGHYRFTARFMGAEDVSQSRVAYALFQVTR